MGAMEWAGVRHIDWVTRGGEGEGYDWRHDSGNWLVGRL